MWSVIETAGNDDGEFPIQQIRYMGKSGDSAAWFPYGLHARAGAKDLAALLAISGQAGNRVHLPGSPRKRPRIEEGEVVLYHPSTGSKVYLKKDGTIEITAADDQDIKLTTGGDIECSAATLRQTGAAVVTAGLTIGGAINHNGTQIGFFGESPTTRPAITGTNDGNLQVLEDLCNRLHELGLIDDANYPR